MNYEELFDGQLDAEVAKKIMGFTHAKLLSGEWVADGWDTNGNYFVKEPDGNKTIIANREWQPATSIAQAFDVVDKMIADGYYFSLYCGLNKMWEVDLHKHYSARAKDTSLPRAICIGALKAVEAKEKE